MLTYKRISYESVIASKECIPENMAALTPVLRKSVRGELLGNVVILKVEVKPEWP